MKFQLFDAHSDIFENVHEKRARGLTDILDTFHAANWEAGGCVGGFCPIWIDPSRSVYPIPYEEQAKQILGHMEEELRATTRAVMVTSHAAYLAAVEQGLHAIFTGTEGLCFLRGDYGKLDALYDHGMREFSLTWNESNEFAGGAGDIDGPGLSEAGKQCVKRIHSLGAVLDLAHANRASYYDALRLTDGPYMVSHSNAGHFCSHPRTLTDEQIKLAADYHGVIGISGYPPFLSDDPAEWTVQKLCDHVEYVAGLAGIECVGLGFDLVDFLDDADTDSSISDVTKGLEDISKAQNIAAELLRRGFRPADVEAVFHGNFLRLVKEVIG